jgi:hypothetical protein
VGDAPARLLRAEGAAVTTGYYFNDAGAQIDRFAASLLAAARQEAVLDDGYAGEYIGEIADTVLKDHPDVLGKPAADAQEIFRDEGVALMFGEIKTSLARRSAAAKPRPGTARSAGRARAARPGWRSRRPSCHRAPRAPACRRAPAIARSPR